MNNSLLPLFERGGFFYDLEGVTPKEAINSLTGQLRLPGGLSKDELLAAVLEREDLQPTSIGHGIALPHPRNLILTNEDTEFIAVGFMKNPVSWQTPDGEAVRTLMLIVSASAKNHLHTLSKINYLCEQEILCGLLKSAAAKEMLIPYIIKAETLWSKSEK